MPQETINKTSGGKLKPSCDSLINCGSSKKEICGGILLGEGLEVFDNYEFI